ncbi:hypothetical protein [Vulcanisaeta distributa]|nr:hypothetical protein [Vulcanisaeta distributa]
MPTSEGMAKDAAKRRIVIRLGGSITVEEIERAIEEVMDGGDCRDFAS